MCWSSKLQSEIALSTLEAEYIALSQGMRELVSARRLVLELGERMNMNLKSVSQVSKAWEDNVGTQNLANSKGPRMTSWTKYIGIKFHWFRSKIQSNEIVVQFNIIMRSNSCNGLPIAIISESVALEKPTNSAPGGFLCFPVVSHTTTRSQRLPGSTVIP